MDELFYHYADLIVEEKKISEERKKSLFKLREEIIDSLVWDPGQLIPTNYMNKMKD